MPSSKVRAAVAALAALAGCATLAGGARDHFARHVSCPPDRVRVVARPDVAPHTFLGSGLRTPPPDVAADPARLAYFEKRQAEQVEDLDDSCDVYEASGCGQRTLLCCSHDDDNGAIVDCVAPTGWAAHARRGAASGEVDSVGPPEGSWQLRATGCELPGKNDHALISTVLLGRDGLRIGLNLSRSRRSGLNLSLVNLGDPHSETFDFQERSSSSDQTLYGWGNYYLCSSVAGSARLVSTEEGDSAFDGTLELSCRTSSGSTVRGSLVLNHCPL